MILKNLFKPIMLGKVEVKNRIALAPMGLGIYNPDGTFPEKIQPFLEACARGGTGLIISQFAKVSKYQPTVAKAFDLLAAYDDRFIPSLSKYASAVHKYNARVFLQIASFGGKLGGSYGPSAIENPLYPSRARELNGEQVKEVIGEFIAAARRAQEAGFDGVELHGAHSYLIGQFMSPHFNRRDDEYGGDFERRMRFPTEILRGIKKTCGKDFPVGLKFSAWEEVPNGIDHELALKIAQRMAAEGIAYLHTQTTAFFPPIAARSKYPTMSPMYLPRNTLLELAERIKRKIKNVPVLASGGIVDPREADKIIADGKADMVVLGRALLADHEWPNKAKEGRRIRPCIRCNVCHYEIAGLGKEGVCSVNPHFLHELEEPLGKVKESKKVAVVGAGPGGIIAALTACQRGHEVTLYEKQNRVGGLLILASAPSFKRDLKALLEYYQAEIRDSRVKLKLNTKATPDTIRRVEPDALIIAVGSPPVRPEIPGIDRDNVITAEEALQNPRRVKGKNVVVIGGGVVGCETALHLARKSKNVVIVELLEKLMPLEENRNNIVVLEELLEKAGVKAYTRSKPVEITSEDVWIITDGDKMQKIPADTTVLAIGRKPDSEFIDALKQSCSESYVIGDSVKEGRIFEAVHDADHTARQI